MNKFVLALCVGCLALAIAHPSIDDVVPETEEVQYVQNPMYKDCSKFERDSSKSSAKNHLGGHNLASMGKECACTKPPTYRKYRSNGETYNGPAYQPKKQHPNTWTPSWSNICGGKNAKGCANGKCKSVKGMKAAYEAAQAKKAASRCACAVAGSRNTPSSKQQVLSFKGQCKWPKWPKNLAQWNKPTGFGYASRKNGAIEKFFDMKGHKLDTPLTYFNPNGCPTMAPDSHEHNAPDWSKNKKTMQTSWKGKDFYSIACQNCKMAMLHDDDRHQTGWGGKTVDNKDICSGGKCCGKTVHFTAPHDLQHDLEYITLGGPC